jgi:hypothetical protein
MFASRANAVRATTLFSADHRSDMVMHNVLPRGTAHAQLREA